PEGLPAVAPLADDLAKLEFKLSEPGLRRDLGDMPRVDLPSRPTDGPWLAAFRDRRSHRTFLSESISFAGFGRGLGALAEEEGAGRPRFAASDPSLDIFVGVKPGRVEGVVGGLSRYDPAWHRRVLVEAGLEIGPLAHASVNRVIAESAAFNVLLVGSASGEAHDAGLLAAGVAGQALMEDGPGVGLGVCPIGTLDLGGEDRRFRGSQLLHSLLGGAVVPQAQRGAADAAPGTAAGELQGRTPVQLVRPNQLKRPV